MVAFGAGNDVRWGFVPRAEVMAAADAGGVINVMSEHVSQLLEGITQSIKLE